MTAEILKKSRINTSNTDDEWWNWRTYTQSRKRMRKRWKLERNDKKIRGPTNLVYIQIIGPPEMQSGKTKRIIKEDCIKKYNRTEVHGHQIEGVYYFI